MRTERFEEVLLPNTGKGKRYIKSDPLTNEEILNLVSKPIQIGTLTKPVQERFRLIPSRFEHNDTDQSLDDYEVTHYALGNRFAKTDFKKTDFDSISVIRKSVCPVKNTRHLHALGHRRNEKQDTFLILTEI